MKTTGYGYQTGLCRSKNRLDTWMLRVHLLSFFAMKPPWVLTHASKCLIYF